MGFYPIKKEGDNYEIRFLRNQMTFDNFIMKLNNE